MGFHVATIEVNLTVGGDEKELKLYDPWYLNTTPIHSSISYIDGDEGILWYGGYPIEELVEKSISLENGSEAACLYFQ